jgi:hypothetical protein
MISLSNNFCRLVPRNPDGDFHNVHGIDCGTCGNRKVFAVGGKSFCRGLGAPNLRHFLHLASKIQAGSAFASTNLSHNSILRPNGWA